MTTIIEALGKLDATNDQHWTADGLPRIDTVKFLMGGQPVDRDDISKAAPGFSRANTQLQAAQGEQAPASGVATNTPLIVAPGAAGAAAQPINGGDNGEVHQEAKEGADATESVSKRAALEAELAGAQDVLAEIEQAFVRAETVRSEARAEVDRIITAIDNLPKEPATSTILGYLASQARELEQRGEQRRKLRESDIDLKALNAITGASALDNSFARKKAFGGLRPSGKE